MNHGQQELKNELHERYCRLRSQGFSQCKSYQRAQVVDEGEEIQPVSKGVARTAGWRLEKDADINTRIKYLKNQRLEKFKNIEKALEEHYKKAIDNKSYSANNHLAAMRDCAKFIGKVTETVNHNHTGNVILKVEFE